jgi:hypothetical protein
LLRPNSFNDPKNVFNFLSESAVNLAKLDDGLDESQTVMAGEDNNNKNSVKIGAY